MGSSLVLTGGAATARTLKESISLASHGFTVGDVLRWNNGSPSYVRAQADSAVNAEVLGIVSAKVDTNTFELTYGGYIDLPQFAGISYPVLFLSGVCAGGLTHNPPSALGTVVKPVVTRHPTLNGFVLNNYLGTQIGGSSTIGIDEIQPVGTIMPFAGTSIPDTWLECNGGTYSIGSYTELYSKLCYTTGDRAPIYGHIVSISLSAGSASIHTATQVGDYVFVKNHNNAAAGTLTNPSSTPWGTLNGTDVASHENTWDVYGLVVSKGVGHDGGAYGLQVQILPKWTATGPSNTRRFIMPNFFVQGLGSNTNPNPAASAVRVISGADAKTDRGVASINTVQVLAFNVPDLSGRTPIGVMSTDSDAAGAEGDNPYIHITGQYGPIALGAMGGEDRHQLTIAEMPAHDHALFGTLTTALARTAGAGELQVNVGTAASEYPVFISDTGSNTPHNNMPPYLAVRYIIKAKPYTRAAIIDGVDLPYSNLLIRSTDSNSLRSELLSGASGGDLVFYTNGGETSKTGTERMRIYGSGNPGDILFSGDTNNTSRNPLILSVGGSQITNNKDDAFFISTKQDGTTVGYFGFNGYSTQSLKYTEWQLATRGQNDTSSQTRLYVNNLGNVGIHTGTPGASLDVNGTLKVGDFGGATNVMVKPSNTTPGAVGYVQPFYFASSGGITSNGIPAGTWFVYGQWVENTNSAYDNDPTNYMAKVWTVPTGKYLHIASDDQLWGTGTTDDGKGGKINLHWKMSNNAIETIKGAVSNWGGGWTAFVIPPTLNPSATTVGSDTVTAMSGYVFGYAEYDTYGVRGTGNNTPLGSGYGYIQRLA